MSEEQNKEIKLKKIFRKERKQKEEYLDGWKRARADLMNYKKDELKRVNSHLFYEKKKMLLKIISILDNFDRAEKETKKTEPNEIINGFLIIKKQIKTFLEEEGIREIETVGKEFDPQFHEAVEVVKTDKEEEVGMIMEELEKGYTLEQEIIRASKVRVAQ